MYKTRFSIFISFSTTLYAFFSFSARKRRCTQDSPTLVPQLTIEPTIMNINEPIQGKGLNVPFFRPSTKSGKATNRIPFARKLPDNVRNHIVAMAGEFAGTVLFLFFAFAGTQVANNIPSTELQGGTVRPPADAGANPAQLLYISLCFGFSLAVNAWVFFRISGGLFNPAV